MEVIWIWLISSAVVGLLAKLFRRSVIAWFLFSLFLSPLVGLIGLLVFGVVQRCPKCKKGIDKNASWCMYCGAILFETDEELESEPAGSSKQD